MKAALTLLIALLLAPLAALHAADALHPAAKVRQELLNSIHVPPKLILDPFPAYAQKYLPFAMAASMEVTRKGRLWTCWAGGQDGPNAYLLASYSDDHGKSWRDPVFVIDPQAHGLKMGTRLGSFWCDPKGRLWLFFHQSVGMFDGSCSNWFVRCDDPGAEKPVWTEPVYVGFEASIDPILKLKRLQSLRIEKRYDNGPGDTALAKLSQLATFPDLKSLSLHYFSKATDADLTALASATRLDPRHRTARAVTLLRIAALTTLTEIQICELSCCRSFCCL